jgi:hypothetical protein
VKGRKQGDKSKIIHHSVRNTIHPSQFLLMVFWSGQTFALDQKISSD